MYTIMLQHRSGITFYTQFLPRPTTLKHIHINSQFCVICDIHIYVATVNTERILSVITHYVMLEPVVRVKRKYVGQAITCNESFGQINCHIELTHFIRWTLVQYFFTVAFILSKTNPLLFHCKTAGSANLAYYKTLSFLQCYIS